MSSYATDQDPQVVLLERFKCINRQKGPNIMKFSVVAMQLVCEDSITKF
jgi:hypothetical protein